MTAHQQRRLGFAIILSVALHIIALLVLSSRENDNQSLGLPPDYLYTYFEERSEKVSNSAPIPETKNEGNVVINVNHPTKIDQQIDDHQGTITTKDYQAFVQYCSTHNNVFMGVGMVANLGTNVVLQSPPFLPAYQHGIRIDDVIESNIRNDNVQYIVISRPSTGERFSVRIRIENLCLYFSDFSQSFLDLLSAAFSHG